MERGSDPPDGFTAGAQGIRIGARVCDPKLVSLAVLGIRDCRREGLAVPGSPEKGAGYLLGRVGGQRTQHVVLQPLVTPRMGDVALPHPLPLPA